LTAKQIFDQWFKHKGWKSFPFQRDMLKAFTEEYSGILNAPTGAGKTYAVFIPFLANWITNNNKPAKGLQLIWISPLRALSIDIRNALQAACDDLALDWRVEIRSGDTDTKTRAAQKKNMPEVLVTTPESIHILFASKGYEKLFNNLQCLVVDEWHELLGNKRGIQVELAMSRFKAINHSLLIWGISATIGNMDDALSTLLGDVTHEKRKMVKSGIEKKVNVISLLPDETEHLSWGGHLGVQLIKKLKPVIDKHKTTLIFTNTRAQCEIWYHRLINEYEDLAGLIAMHHGSLSREIRDWVEDALHKGILKAVVCTSSLDLGVDFRPVEAVVQIGGPKGVSRFTQRAGRSGHKPGEVSNIYFLPTHSLEIVEGAALKMAMKRKYFENRNLIINPIDVLVQYLVTLAVSDGFKPKPLLKEIKTTAAYAYLTDDEWRWCLNYITSGGKSLEAYDDYDKVDVIDGVFKVTSRKIAGRHRMSIGTIVGNALMKVQYMAGTPLGTVEESFARNLKKGQIFWFAGKPLQMVMIKDMSVIVKKAKATDKGKIPAWGGGKMSLSSHLGQVLRETYQLIADGKLNEPELKSLKKLFDIQRERSFLPNMKQTLIEEFKTDEGHHIYVYPFEGKFVHEIMGNLMAYRISKMIEPMSFSIATNDYGFEILSDKPIPIEDVLGMDVFSTDNLTEDINNCMNLGELASSKFRGIAMIAGLIFQGFPGKGKQNRHLQASSGLLFRVFHDYDKDNLLMKQAYQEVFDLELEEGRLRNALKRIRESEIILKKLEKMSPFCYPIKAEGIRGRVTYEKLDDRLDRMKLKYD